MPLGKGSFRSRAATLLRASTPSALNSIGQGTQEKGSDISSYRPTGSPLNEKNKVGEGPNDPEKLQTPSSNGGTYRSSGSNAVTNERAAQRIVRTIPSQSSIYLFLPISKQSTLIYKLQCVLTSTSLQVGYTHLMRTMKISSLQRTRCFALLPAL